MCTPRCLGDFDDYDPKRRKEHTRHDLVWEKPEVDSMVFSLHRVITEFPKPPSKDRIILAYKLAAAIQYLHSVHRTHKALRSDNVLFFSSNDTLDIAQPRLVGFKYSRSPGRDGRFWEGPEAACNVWTELYAHPDCPGMGNKPTYRKTFDIYSLGVILLEISHWKTIDHGLGLNMNHVTTRNLNAANIRYCLLELDKKFVGQVLGEMGETYQLAVRCCLDGSSMTSISYDNQDFRVRLDTEFAKTVLQWLEYP